MNRTYNFQVDNGLFVAEYYLKKDYNNITIQDLKDNIELFANKMFDLNKLSTLSSTSHNNSSLANPSLKSNRLEKIEEQLKDCVDNVAEHKICTICCEKRVNVAYKVNSSLMAMIPSLNTFANKSNNLHTIDICPICLFFSCISFLNTQKISYPFLYLSNSDEYMRDITKQIQINVSKNILTEMKQKDMDKHLLNVLNEVAFADEIYDDIDYIDLIYFANAQKNYYEEQTIDRQKLVFLMKLKNKQLINEFVGLNLFKDYIEENIKIRKIIKKDNKNIYNLLTSKELYDIIKEEVMTNKEIEIIEYATKVLIEYNSIEDLLKELKLCSNSKDFENFIIKHSQEETIYKSLLDYNELRNIYKYKDILIANLLLNK